MVTDTFFELSSLEAHVYVNFSSANPAPAAIDAGAQVPPDSTEGVKPGSHEPAAPSPGS